MSFQQEHGILVASPAAYDRPPPSSRWLIESCRRYGIELTLLGEGQPYPNDRAKIRLVADYLAEHPEYRYVLQIDFRDVVVCATLREMFYKYLAFDRRIVMSAEGHCWPISSHAPDCPETGTTYRYANTGAIFATSDAWLAAWDVMCAKERLSGGVPPEIGFSGRHIFNCDQAAWSDLYIHAEADVALDAECQLFLTLVHVDRMLGTANPDLEFEGTRVLNRETGGRPCLVHCNAGIPVEPWGRYVLEPAVTWCWPLIDRIRTGRSLEVSDAASVERLLMDFGLHEPIDDDVPIHLLPFSGKGLAIRRRPTEYAAFLAWLASRPPIESYVEIGVGNGGSFIATVEYLRRFHPLGLAMGIGRSTPAMLLDYTSRLETAHYIHGDHAVDGLRSIVDCGGRVDLAVINALRPGYDFEADWEYLRNCCRYVAIHGIGSVGSPAVPALWRRIQASRKDTYEFVDADLESEYREGLGIVDFVYD